MSLNQSFISKNIHADLKGPNIKYKLHYGRCMGRLLRPPHCTTLAVVKANKNQK